MSQDEPVDIINENGELLKVVTKREAHEQGLLHKTTISQVIDSQGRWLMVKQSAAKQDAGQYVSPVGGHVTAGESEEEAVKREAFEEVGIKGDFKLECVGSAVFSRTVIGRHENHLFIMFKIYSDAKPVLNEESDSCKYFTEDELRTELKEHPEHFGDAFHFCIKNFFPQLNSK